MTQDKRSKFIKHLGFATGIAVALFVFFAIVCVSYYLLRWAVGW